MTCGGIQKEAAPYLSLRFPTGNLESRIMCFYAAPRVRFRHFDDRFMLVSGQKCNQAISTIAKIMRENAKSIRLNAVSLSLASELHHHKTR